MITATAPRPWWETRAFVVALMVLAVVPLIVPEVPPLVDLPGHMGRYRIALGGSPLLDRYYSFHWLLSGNVGGDLMMVPLSRVLGVEVATKLVVMAIPVGIVGALFALAREVYGRAPPTLALAVPLIYTHPFLFGFLNYMLGVTAMLWTLWLFIRLGNSGRTRLRAVLLLPLSVAVFLLHASAWGVLGLMAFAAEWTRRRRDGAPRRRATLDTVAQLLPLATPLLLLVLWQSGAAGTTRTSYQPLLKLADLAVNFRDRWITLDVITGTLFYSSLIGMGRNRNIRWDATFGVAAMLIAIAYFLTPFRLFGSDYADTRLMPVLLMAVVLAIAPPSEAHREVARVAAIGAAAFAVVRIGLTTASFLVSAREQAAILPALDHVERGARVALGVGDPCGVWALNRNTHMGSMAIVRREAFSNDQWLLPGSVAVDIHYPAAGRFAHDPAQRLSNSNCPPNLLPQFMHDLPAAAFDYVWLISAPPMPAEQLSRWRLVYAAPGSMLYRRIDAPSSGATAPSPGSTAAPAPPAGGAAPPR